MKRIFLAVGIALTIFLCAGLFLLKVKSVSCTTLENKSCTRATQELLQPFVGKRLLNAEKEIKKILSTQTEIQQFSVSTSPLGNISVRVLLRNGDIGLKPETSDTYTLYTKEGIVVKDVKETNLPIVVLREQLDTAQIAFVVNLSYQLTTMLPVKEMKITGSSLVVTLRDDRNIYYPLSGDVDLLLGITVATFSQLNLSDGKLIIDGKAVGIREIDLRFKNPVLR